MSTFEHCTEFEEFAAAATSAMKERAAQELLARIDAFASSDAWRAALLESWRLTRLSGELGTSVSIETLVAAAAAAWEKASQ